MDEDIISNAEVDAICKDIENCIKEKTETKEIIKKAYNDALYQYAKTQFLRHFVADFMENGKIPSEIKDPKYLEIMDKNYERISSKPPYYFITLNPKPGVSFEDFAKLVEKQISKKGVRHYMYVYEIRNADFGGLHCHMLLETSIRPYDFKRSLKNTFKNVMIVDNPEILNIKNIQYDIVMDKVNYMLGQKKDSKQKGVELTEIWRGQCKILPYYESSPPFPCRATQKILD